MNDNGRMDAASAPAKEPSRVSILGPRGFDVVAHVWKRARGPRPSAVDRLTLVSYNLWFGEYCWRERLAVLLANVRDCRPDIIGLQEVTPAHLEQILAQDWVRERYQVSDTDGVTLEPHGVLLLSRLPVASLALCHLPSRKDRKMVVGEVETAEGTIFVGVVHLESAPLAMPLRLEQLDRVLPGLHGGKNTVLMGDFNFDPRDRTEQSRIEPGYTDLWPALNSGDPGYTVDTVHNRMRFLHKQRHKRARFDRILLRSVEPVWEPASIRMIGTRSISPAQPDVFPSDHFGLVGVISRRRVIDRY